MENRSNKPSPSPEEAAGSQTDHSPEDENDRGDGPSGLPREVGGRKGPEPTRFGDWEKNGRCIDF
jgi:hypothetical protein